jgi:hypothetical protein
MKLLDKINAAVKAADEAEQNVTTAQAELTSRSKTVGLLLLEAKKLHPKVKDFDAFLKKVNGLSQSRAYDLMRLAGGRTTDDELKKDARERQQRKRERDKLPKPTPDPPAFRDVTETPEDSAERRKAEYADIDLSDSREARQSAHYLAEFTAACHLYLPGITVEADKDKALSLVARLTGSRRAEAA